MAGFSHEIKTPMTVIIGFADILRTGVYDEETRKKAAQYIYTEGKRLEKLSFTLMDLLKLSHQAVELQPVCLSSISCISISMHAVSDHSRSCCSCCCAT